MGYSSLLSRSKSEYVLSHSFEWNCWRGYGKNHNPSSTRRGCFLCWQWAIFPVRRQTSIVATAELNFRVRNGNGWTLCVKITNYAPNAFFGDKLLAIYPTLPHKLRHRTHETQCECRHWAIFPVRRQTSIVATAELNFRVRNGNGWTLCVKITDYNEQKNAHWEPNKGER